MCLQVSFDVPIETATAPARPASPAQEPAPQPAEAPMANNEEGTDQDADDSWVEVVDEDVTRAKEKGKASGDAHVLEDTDS